MSGYEEASKKICEYLALLEKGNATVEDINRSCFSDIADEYALQTIIGLMLGQELIEHCYIGNEARYRIGPKFLGFIEQDGVNNDNV